MRNEGVIDYVVNRIKDELEKVKDGLLVKCPDCGRVFDIYGYCEPLGGYMCEETEEGLMEKVVCPNCGTEEYDCGDVFDEATLEDWLEDWKAWELTDGIYVITDDEDMLYYVVDIEAGDVHVETFEEVFENGNTFAA